MANSNDELLDRVFDYLDLCAEEIEKLQEDKEFRKQLDKLREGQEELRVGQGPDDNCIHCDYPMKQHTRKHNRTSCEVELKVVDINGNASIKKYYFYGKKTS